MEDEVRRQLERFAGVAGREDGELLAGSDGPGLGELADFVQGAVGVDEVEDLVRIDPGEAAVLQDGLDEAPVGGFDPGEEEDQGQGQLAFFEVGEDGLAELALAGGEVEEVVDELEAD